MRSVSYELEAKITFELQPHRREGAVKGNPQLLRRVQGTRLLHVRHLSRVRLRPV